jgi:hypothetical protein
MPNLTEVDFGHGLTRVDESFCIACRALIKATIRSQCTQINWNAFGQCSSLTTIVCEATTPPTLNANALTGTSALTAIYVPDASVAAYKAANNWNSYASIIKGISERPTT